ncbi:glutaredoxin family protein [Halioxenophilus aromaticivorans]|uniref:Glutaredoxin family protein n=1 Tax=Halioxenophilus aromaticivorans TaxID=1306992 RepID=A0AAV3TYG1_9ALTE
MSSNEKSLYLLTTLGCSLCQKAKLEIYPALSATGLQLVEVEITDHAHLIALFADKIPVVTLAPASTITSRTQVLEWPFDSLQVQQLCLQR